MSEQCAVLWSLGGSPWRAGQEGLLAYALSGHLEILSPSKEAEARARARARTIKDWGGVVRDVISILSTAIASKSAAWLLAEKLFGGHQTTVGEVYELEVVH